jgi:endonuclease YncB( thermonuclease family)
MPPWRRPSGAASPRSARAFRSTDRPDRRAVVRSASALAAGLLLVAATTAAAQSVDGLARVTDAGHLIVGGREIALAGIEIPDFDRTCRRTVTPIRCGPRAVLILDGKVRGFVHCDILGKGPSGLPEGRCTIAGRRMLDDRIDLAAEMLREGWAFARDDASGSYRALERLARTREVGMWKDAAVDLR